MEPVYLLSGRPAPKRLALLLIAAFTTLVVVAVLTASCGGGTATTSDAVITSTPDTGGSGAEVTMKGFAFDPSTVTIKAGESVTWTNQDSANHTVVADDGEFTSGGLAKGDAFTFKFEAAGTYAYHCSVHPSMTATVIVQ